MRNPSISNFSAKLFTLHTTMCTPKKLCTWNRNAIVAVFIYFSATNNLEVGKRLYLNRRTNGNGHTFDALGILSLHDLPCGKFKDTRIRCRIFLCDFRNARRRLKSHPALDNISTCIYSN